MRVRKAGVIGAGAMGAALAELLAFNGVEVALKDVDAPTVERGLARVRAIVDELVEFQAGRVPKELDRLRDLGVALAPEQVAALSAKLAPKVDARRAADIVARVQTTTQWEPFAEVDLVIEAVFERFDVKRTVLEAVDAILPEGNPLASNTSSLSITRLARGLRHARETLVLHFFNPPSALPLVEVAGGVETREDVLDGIVEFVQGLRNHRYPMVPIRVKESPAFVVNRLLIPVLNEACFALEEGLATSRDIDLAMKSGAGLPMGPFELADLIGLDVTLDVAETMQHEFGDPKYRPSRTLRRLVDAGHLGRKSGRGFYEYR